MKKILVALLIIAIFTIILSGCGGSDPAPDKTQTTTSTNSTDPTTPSPNNTPSATSTNTKLPLPKPFEYIKGSLPDSFEEAIEDGFVVLVLFTDSQDLTSNRVEDIVADVVSQPNYSKKVKYFSYNMSTAPSSSVAKLSTALNAINIPNISIVDTDKNITFEDSGFTEYNYIEHALYNAVFVDKASNNSTSQVNQ